MGFDLVAFSRAKGLRGPQSAGLLLGPQLSSIAAARRMRRPTATRSAGGMKVNKEEMLGMLAALETYLGKDHAGEQRDFAQRAETIRASAAAVPGVKAAVFVPDVANHVPHVRVSWDATAAGQRDDAGRRGQRRCGPESRPSAPARRGTPSSSASG